jgi:hypothetical protein
MPTTPLHRIIVAPAATLAILLAAPALAQETGQASGQASVDAESLDQALADAADITFEIEPRLWYAALSADLRFPGGEGRLDSEERDFDDSEAAFLGRIRARAGKLSFSLSGFAWGTDTTEVADGDFSAGGLSVAEGESYSVDVDLDSVELFARWQWWSRSLAPAWENADPVTLRFEAGGGVRAYLLDASFNVIGGDARAEDDAWVEPALSAALAMDLGRDLTIETEFGVGFLDTGERESSSFDITLRGEWRFNDTFSAVLGYRFFSADLSDGDDDDEFSLDGSVAGLLLGATIRF